LTEITLFVTDASLPVHNMKTFGGMQV